MNHPTGDYQVNSRKIVSFKLKLNVKIHQFLNGLLSKLIKNFIKIYIFTQKYYTIYLYNITILLQNG